MTDFFCLWCEQAVEFGSKVTIDSTKFGLNHEFSKEIIFCRCIHCKSYSQFPLLSSTQLEALYDDNYLPYISSPRDQKLILTKAAYRLSPKLKRAIEKNYAHEKNECSAVDIGAGTSRFGELLQLRGYTVTLVDLSERLSQEAKLLDMKFVRAGSDDLAEKFALERFSRVHAAHVIEHVSRPKKFLIDLINMTEPGGTIHISFPRNDSILVRLKSNRWLSGFEPRHLQLPNQKTLRYWLQTHERIETVEMVNEGSPIDITRWILGRYELSTVPPLARKILVAFSFVIAKIALVFGNADRVHVICKIK